MLDLVCDDFRTGALNYQNTLIVVVRDDVGVWERLDSDLSRDCNLIVVQILQVVGRLLLNGSRRLFHHVRKNSVSRATTSHASTFKRADCFFLGGHESVVVCVYGLLRVWNELDIRLFCATDMCDGVFGQLNARLAVLLDDVAAHVGVALAALDDDAVVSAGVDGILPNFGCAQLRPIRSCDLDAILVTSVNLVLDQVRLIIVDLDSNFIQVKGVTDDERLDIKIGIDSSASAEINPVLCDARPTLLALDVDAVRVAGDDVVVSDLYLVLWARLDHDTARLEVLEFTRYDLKIGVNADQPCRACIVRGVSLELTADHSDAGALERRDARHLSVSLSEYSTITSEELQ